jgi:hypothetical protein
MTVMPLLVSAMAVHACGPIRLDATPQVRGSVVGVEPQRLTIRHKTGYTYDVAVTPETRIVQGEDVVDLGDVCTGQRAIVILSEADHTQASEVRVAGKRCR